MKNNIPEKYFYKILGLLLVIIFFSLIYNTLDASNFEGINPLQDLIKEKIVHKEVQNIIESYFDNKEEDIGKIKLQEDVKKVVESDQEKIEKPSFYQQYFDRLYFSIITSCLLGYGDIYPATNIVKTLVSIQSLLTLFLILY